MSIYFDSYMRLLKAIDMIEPLNCPEAEDAIRDKMDDYWWNMSQEEQQEVRTASVEWIKHQ